MNKNTPDDIKKSTSEDQRLEIKAINSEGTDFYTVDFLHKKGKLSVYCSCAAGEQGKFCKHKWDLLGGNADRLWDASDTPALEQVKEWVKASSFETLYADVNRLEEQVEFLKEKIKIEKKLVERKMRDGF